MPARSEGGYSPPRQAEKLFLDTEFNGFGGQLISMGITTNNGREFYEVLPLPEKVDPWVRHHVIPVLDKQPIPKTIFQAKLQSYLQQFPLFTVIADWPEDIAHFNQSMIIKPGQMIRLPSFHMEVIRDRSITTAGSKKPHNALEDARALKNAYNARFNV